LHCIKSNAKEIAVKRAKIAKGSTRFREAEQEFLALHNNKNQSTFNLDKSWKKCYI
jgi:hypothetical protein